MIPTKEYAILTGTIVLKNILFDYATQFQRTHPEIRDAKSFKVTDEIYADFTAFVLAQDFEYTTASLQLLKDLEEAAQKEESYNPAQAEFEALLAKLKPSKVEDLQKYKAELVPLIEDEIVGRYYYQKGRIIHSLVDDEYINSAIEILNDIPRYKKVLNLEN